MQGVVLLLSVVACVVALPQGIVQDVAAAAVAPLTPIPILLDERTPIDHLGGYGFRIQTGNGITWAENASPNGPQNDMVMTGQYRFVHPDGTEHLLTYTAGKNGFQPISNMIPTPHPLEPWHIEQIEFAARQKAEAEARAAAEAAAAAEGVQA